MQAADDMDLGGPGRRGLAGDAEDILVGELIGARLAALALKFAELAGQAADIGVVDVAVDVVIGAVGVLLAAEVVGQFAQGENVAGVPQGHAVGEGKRHSVNNLVSNSPQTSIGKKRWPQFDGLGVAG